MRLKSLRVFKTVPQKEDIRYIEFNSNGLNLIVDKTSDISQDSGNSVGKSTLIHIIDLCLNAKSVNKLYKGKDSDGENIEIKDLLEKSKVQATLEVTDGRKIHSFTRSLFNRGKRQYNGKDRTESEYEQELKKIFFNSSVENPSFRQLISKFVRTDEKQLSNVLYYLIATKYITYEAIYFFLLHIDSEKNVSERQVLEEKKRQLNIKLDYYKKDPNIPSVDYINQSLSIMEKELLKLNKERESINYVELYTEELNKQSDINTQIDSINSNIQLLRFEKQTIKKSIESIINSKSDIDLSVIKTLYKEAKNYNESLSKEFEDVVHFHNQMIENRYQFINKQFIRVERKISLLLEQRALLLNQKKDLSIELIDEGLLENIDEINRKIDELNIQKGEFSKALSIMNSLIKEINNINEKIKELNENSEEDIYIKPISEFNEIFSRFSELLYGEKYILVYNSNWREENGGKPFSIGNLKGNVGTGKQRALTIAFDLAYLSYAKANHISSPSFVIYDQLENTHINQLSTIFNLSQIQEGQLILPILSERINEIDIETIRKSTIIELSQENKFFRI